MICATTRVPLHAWPRRGPPHDGQASVVSPHAPSEPAGKINVNDPDSQLVKSLHGWVQGYTAQAAAAAAGVAQAPEAVLADAGFYNLGHVDRLRQRGMRVLVSPDASGRREPGLTRRKPAYQQMRDELVSDAGYELYRRPAQIVFAHIKILRRTDRFQRGDHARAAPSCDVLPPPTTCSSSGASPAHR